MPLELVDIATERSTAATDVALALLALVLAAQLIRTPLMNGWRTKVWVFAFCLLGAGASLGAIVHGLVLPEELFQLLENALILCLGLMIALFVVASVHDIWGEPRSRRLLLPMLSVGIAFFVITLFSADSFVLFIFYQSVATLFALAGYAWLSYRRSLGGAGWIAAGILVTILAAAVQATGSMSVRIIWPLDHNGIFHLMQMPGLLLMMRGLRGESGDGRGNSYVAVGSRRESGVERSF